MMREERHTDTFEAIDEKGERQRLHVFVTFTASHPLSGETTWIPGSKRIQTDDGEHVNVRSDGTLVTLHGGRVLRPVDPIPGFLQPKK